MGDIFQSKIDEIFKHLPGAFGITNDILIVGFERDGKDHDETLQRVLQRCGQVNIKLNKDKFHFRCTQVLSLVKLFPEMVSNLIHKKLNAMMGIPSPKNQKKRTPRIPWNNKLSQ